MFCKLVKLILIGNIATAFSICCDDGWSFFESNCYKLTLLKEPGINWFDAQKECEEMGSNLASIHNMGEQLHIAAIIAAAQTNIYGIWIGLNRTVPHGSVWRWTDQSPTDFTFWLKPNPSDSTWFDPNGEICVNMYGNSSDPANGWNDIACYLYAPQYKETMGGFVCKKHYPTYT